MICAKGLSASAYYIDLFQSAQTVMVDFCQNFFLLVSFLDVQVYLLIQSVLRPNRLDGSVLE